MMNRGRSYQKVGLRENVPHLPALLDQEPPLEHDVLRYLENPMFKHRSHFVREPLVQFGPAIGLGQEFYAKPDFSEG